MERRKFRLLEVTNEFLQNMIGNISTIITKDGKILTLDGLPKDAYLLDSYKDITRDSLIFAIYSKSFPEVPEGAVGEYVRVTIREASLGREGTLV